MIENPPLDVAKFSATIQGQAYSDCLRRYSNRHQFLGFIDVDEFVVLLDSSIKKIDDLLKRYEAFGGLSLYWRIFGSSGQREKSTKWVTSTYLKCLPRTSKQNTQFKSFVNTAFDPIMYSPHRAMFGNATKYNATNTSSTAFLVDEKARPIAAGRNKNSTHEIAAIYHYVTKSKQDFEDKINRGGGAGVTRPRYYLTKLDQGCTVICNEAATKVKSCFKKTLWGGFGFS